MNFRYILIGSFFTILLSLQSCGDDKTCSKGNEGCECFDNGTCNSDSSGKWLVCSEGICRKPLCDIGTADCACFPNGTCSEGLRCKQDPKGPYCQYSDCDTGESLCGCHADASCNDTSLACISGMCVSANCVPGVANCPCDPSGSCNDLSLSCIGGICSDTGLLQPPVDPKCYTPCKSDYQKDDGTVVFCSDEGLMEGCFGDTQCINGSCIPNNLKKSGGDNQPGTCAEKTDCPDYQTCIQGKCYSNCDANSDCTEGRECSRHVCRISCETGADSCPTGFHCSSKNGENGVCMPQSTPDGSSSNMEGSYNLSIDHFNFTNVHLQDSFTITNNSSTDQEFTILKVKHSYTDDMGYHSITTNPLSWLSFGEWGHTTLASESKVIVPGNGGTKRIVLMDAANDELHRWDGMIEVRHSKLGVKKIYISYNEVPEGQWKGNIYYFANFGDAGLSDWQNILGSAVSDNEYQQALDNMGNALMQKWGVFRKGWISYNEFLAILNATSSGSWNWPSTKSVCPWENGACVLYDNPNGYLEYTSNTSIVPVPGGASQVPISINLHKDPAFGDNLHFSGKISSSDSLNYMGEPGISLSFAGDPSDPAQCSAMSQGACLLYLNSLVSDIYVGGKYKRAHSYESCASSDFSAVRTPWLIEGFTKNTDEDNGQRYTYECRTSGAPFGVSANPDIDMTKYNIQLATSNPIPNGKVIHRHIELIDGILVDQETMIVIFKEHFNSFLDTTDTEGFNFYGVMMLKRESVDLEESDYNGWSVENTPIVSDDKLQVKCTDELIDKVLGTESLSSDTASQMAKGIIYGESSSGVAPEAIVSDESEVVHYYCEDNGLIDGGSNDDGSSSATKEECPWGSRIRYFTLKTKNSSGDIIEECSQNHIANESCQTTGTCQDLLNTWQNNSYCNIRMDPVWRCTNENEIYCDDDRLDLRGGKTFYKESEGEPVFVPIWSSIDNAFRYKTRFRSATGGQVGFAPQICVPNSSAIPYCYDTKEIEEIRDRAECALYLYNTYASPDNEDLTQSDEDMLKNFLTTNFSRDNDNNKDGFEKLYAELLIMLGDEAYTNASASRFDLAGMANRSFPGDEFEDNGIQLSGGAGFELYTLYEAVQYYQMPLDRFYSLSPSIWKNLKNADYNFINQNSVVTYFDRLARASTQKAKVLSLIAQKYQNLNRPDLAKAVIEKAYTGIYLESMVLSKMMLKTVEVSSPAKRDQIRKIIDNTGKAYGAAMLDMRSMYSGISVDINYFGYSPDYIPFPAIDENDVNAFENALATARQTVNVAMTKETQALTSIVDYNTDMASFQSELVQIGHSYENELGEICGTFTGDDGVIYPAIPKYAYLSEKTKYLGNPCGMVGNGTITEVMGDLKIAVTNLKIAIANFTAHLKAIDIEKERVDSYCNTLTDFAGWMLQRGEKHESMLQKRNRWKTVKMLAEQALSFASQKVTALDCIIIVGMSNGTNCPQKGIAFAAFQVARVISLGVIVGASKKISSLEAEMRAHDRYTAYLETVQDCEYAKIDSQAKIATMALDGDALNLEMAKAYYNLLQVQSKVEKYYNKSAKLMEQQDESEGMAIDIEAARNDPNTRIYKNDAVINADRTFNRALKAAYKATKVFEYYTSQSYADKDKLFLVRMVTHGDYTLEAYLDELEDSYITFQESYGTPDTRVAVFSLKNDILDIPRLKDGYLPLSEKERTSLFREKLADPSLLDSHGYISIPFNTNLTRLSPLTRNHKILYIESEIVGSDTGDHEGRVYLRQRGTGVVRGINDNIDYYGLPERTAVINTFYNGERFFIYSDDMVLRNYHLRDRPLVNTRWELILNQVDEYVNKDININSLSDIKLYFYYTDFTSL